jgi:hypothetical protein
MGLRRRCLVNQGGRRGVFPTCAPWESSLCCSRSAAASGDHHRGSRTSTERRTSPRTAIATSWLLDRQSLLFVAGFVGDPVVVAGWHDPVRLVPERGAVTVVPHLRHAVDTHGTLVPDTGYRCVFETQP